MAREPRVKWPPIVRFRNEGRDKSFVSVNWSEDLSRGSPRFNSTEASQKSLPGIAIVELETFPSTSDVTIFINLARGDRVVLRKRVNTAWSGYRRRSLGFFVVKKLLSLN